jgi:hypothetical protein
VYDWVSKVGYQAAAVTAATDIHTKQTTAGHHKNKYQISKPAPHAYH